MSTPLILENVKKVRLGCTQAGEYYSTYTSEELNFVYGGSWNTSPSASPTWQLTSDTTIIVNFDDSR